MEPKPIPRAVLEPLASSAWRADEYSLGKFADLLATHANTDQRAGLTSAYWLRSGRDDGSLSGEEMRAIASAGLVPAGMYREGAEAVGINQHWLHSLEQFYAEVTVAWQKHQKRTSALVGTPAGRTWSDDAGA